MQLLRLLLCSRSKRFKAAHKAAPQPTCVGLVVCNAALLEAAFL
jgi:hypothetical protein